MTNGRGVNSLLVGLLEHNRQVWSVHGDSKSRLTGRWQNSAWASLSPGDDGKATSPMPTRLDKMEEVLSERNRPAHPRATSLGYRPDYATQLLEQTFDNMGRMATVSGQPLRQPHVESSYLAWSRTTLSMQRVVSGLETSSCPLPIFACDVAHRK